MSPFSFTYWMMSKGASATTSTTSTSSPASNVHLNFSFGINRETLITGLIVLASVAFSGFYVYIDVEKMKENAEQERLNSQRDRQVVEEENRRLKKRVLIYEGAQHALNALSIHDCEHYEGVLKASLHQIEQRKLNLLKNEIESEKGNRLCVICQESEKSVVLLPCRHLCLCDGCSNNHPTITKCPLCRKQVSDKINVFA